MPIKATFPGQSEKQIAGFKIIACLNPELGFDSNFYVYLHEMLVNDEEQFSSIDFPEDSPAVRGTVTLNNNDFIGYTFENIDLVQVETIITYKVKHRFLVFRYNPQLFQNHAISQLVSCKSTLSATNIKAPRVPYQYNIKDGDENLLAFNSLLNPSAALQALQVSSFRTSSNSFLSHAIDLHADIMQQRGCNTSFTINGEKIDASAANLKFLLADESYGTFLAFPLPSLDRVTKVTGNLNALVQLRFELFRPVDYYNHYTTDVPLNPFLNLGEIQGQNSIETGIIALANGEGKQLSSVII